MKENKETIVNEAEGGLSEKELSEMLYGAEISAGIDVDEEMPEYTQVVGIDVPEELLADADAEESEKVTEASEAPGAAGEEPDAAAAGEGSEGVRYGLPAGHPEMGELSERIRLRKIEKEKKQRRFRARFYILTVSVILIAAGLIFSFSGFFTVDSIEVRGNSHYTAEEIINMGHAVPGRNLIYNTGASDITEYLEQNPYIKDADVSRKFPSTLVISVTERSESLALRYDEDYLMLDEGGILLKKTRNEPMATIAEGVVVNKIKLGEKIGTEDNKRFEKILKLIRGMNEADLYFVRVDMNDEKKVKAYVYETLVVKTDYDTLMSNMENGRLHLVVEKLFNDGIKRGTITFDEDGTASFMPII